MRPYTIIAPTIWTGDTGQSWKDKGPFYQLMGHYLAESPSSNQYGLYRQSLSELVDDVGVDRATALIVLAFFDETNYARYDARTQWVFVLNMWERQFMASGGGQIAAKDKRLLGLYRWYESCPSNPYLGAFYDRYADDFGLPRRRDAGDKHVRHADARDEVPVVLSDEQRAFCERWIAAYPVHRRSGRAAIYAVWSKLSPPPTAATLEEMLSKLARQAASTRWTDDGGRYVPGAVRYLEEQRWLDDVEDSAGDPEVAQWLKSKHDER